MIVRLLHMIVVCLTLVVYDVSAQQVYREKIVMHTDKDIYHAGDKIWMSIHTLNGRSSHPAAFSRIVYVQLVNQEGHTVVKGVFRVKNGFAGASLTIPDTVKPSVYTLVAFTRWMKNFSQESFFTQAVPVVNGYHESSGYTFALQPPVHTPGKSLDVIIKASSLQFSTRSPVSLQITTQVQNKTVPARFSVSVYRRDPQVTYPAAIIAQGDRTAVEEDFQPTFAPELRGQWITGKVTNKNDNTPSSGIDVYVVVPGGAFGFHNTTTDSIGKFAVQLHDAWPADSIIIRTSAVGNRNFSVQVDDPFVSYRPPTGRMILDVPGEVVRQLRNITEVQRSFTLSVPAAIQPADFDTTPFYGKHDLWYNLDDYTRFPTMEEVFREYIQFVSVKRRAGKFHLAVYNQPFDRMLENDPLILIDGYPVFDVNQLFAFDPLKVQSISVVTRRYFRGSATFDGIVNLSTYSRNLNSYPINKNDGVLKTGITEMPVPFTAPEYATEAQKKDRFPDFRTTLFWRPDAETNSSGTQKLEFYTGDIPGKYLIEVHAITADGTTGSARQFIEVVRE